MSREVAVILESGTGTAPLAGTDVARGFRDPATLEPQPSADSPPATVLPGRHHRSGSGLTDDDGTQYLGLELRALSQGSVSHFSAEGPVLAARSSSSAKLRSSTFIDALSRRDQAVITIMSGAWLACLVVFWQWWLEPAHRIGMFGLAANSLILAYVSGFPAVFVLAANRMRKVNPDIAVPMLRVAFVVTHAPSEPWPVVRVTLDAMLAQDYPLPFDVWICSEKPTQEIVDWCIGRGVGISTRSAEPTYHRDSWPRRTKCKEGNLAYFYDRWGYRSYDVVVQLDCDHVPARDYLAEMVRPFSDPSIGYVAAPSVCDANADDSWAARGRLYKEAPFHGPYQLGHNRGYAPLCIGSHYAVRTTALRDIGGIGPDLAEDFSTTYLLSSAGWHGAFAIEAEAHGDGPNTFGAMAVQEFQWARSLTTITLRLVPWNIRRLPWSLRLRFAYTLSYYSLLVGSTMFGLFLSPVASVTGIPWINVNYLAFLAHWWSISIWLILMNVLIRRRRLLRPHSAPVLSWENWLYSLTRWPFAAFGIAAALLQLARPRQVSFKVTPKSVDGLEPFPVKVLVPFFLISMITTVSALVGERFTSAAGYVFLSTVGGATYAIVTLLLPVLHAREIATRAAASFRTALRQAARVPTILGVCACLLSAVAITLYPFYAFRIFGR